MQDDDLPVRRPTLVGRLSALVVILAVGCAPPTPAVPAAHLDREKCYLEAELAAGRAAVDQCRGPWLTCPARPVILDQLKKTEAQCM